ncbi:Fe(3+)-hydroxamate ABC transporter permease FhuB [Nostoc sp. UHCC 0870]|uniref:Fe(3+)-hydroxamate ABC transporter permease FhuB n=1 Tax=Nostoc sp. UHCC 0870 TaxID=2914041 RepID=UPI001EDFFD01|nr:Fe(3+)-hydroxamate ABC transporter permease FhuB [Nostoc sp. UHCC 0870]UKO97649.1 Fe(3+)-hydroxamate ABC transporter permease FhuB [Nostoc sp. UHCC 0870]
MLKPLLTPILILLPLLLLHSNPITTPEDILLYIKLPRTVIGILSGASLGIAGALFQTVTRNPLASPATLGVNAGAYLAVTATTIFAPEIFTWSPLLVAFTGGLLAALLVYAITGKEITPIRLTLSGMAVSLALAAFTSALQLLYENQTRDLFFWGAGSLLQTNWQGSIYAAPRVLLGAIAVFLIAKPLDVLLLGEDVARSLGAKVQWTRLCSTLLAVFLASVAVSVVGPIGFVGLVAPHIGKLMGCRQHRILLPSAAMWGAVVLLAADLVAQQISSELPAGGITALLGAPFLVWLVRSSPRLLSKTGGNHGLIKSRLPYPVLLFAGVLSLLMVMVLGLSLGNINLGIHQLIPVILGNSDALTERIVLYLRLPRLLVALLAGASLAISGLLLQGVVRNPLAAPEIMGITSGAGLGALLVLLLVPDIPVTFIPIAAFIGAIVAFGVVYLAAWQNGVAPARLALIGIAVSAFCAAGINLLVVKSKLQVAQALVWLAGSTYARQWDEVWQLLAFPLILLPLGWLFARKLDVMALGEDLPRILGMRLQKARGVILAIAVALAAAAVSTVGTISFVGLIAPHAARLLVGSRHRQLVPIAAILGAILVILADTVGRVLLAPKEIPSGLVTALIGTPYFLWLLGLSRR